MRDDRSEWVNVTEMVDPGPVWIRSACRHKDPVPVMTCDSLEPVLVAWLCTDCNAQFTHPDWDTSAPAPRGLVPVRPPVRERAVTGMRAVWGYLVVSVSGIVLSAVLVCAALIFLTIADNLGIG